MRGDLATAIQIAASSHDGQVDKAGDPYIFHPLRVMMAQTYDDARIVAVLHDVVEDDDFGWCNIHDGNFSDHILDAVESVTRKDGEDYFAYVARAKANPIGRLVKIADLNDNMDPRRRPANDHGYAERMAKYSRALAFLLDKTVTQEAA